MSNIITFNIHSLFVESPSKIMANMFRKVYNVGNNSNLMILHSLYDSSQFFKIKWEGHGLVHFHTYVKKLVPLKCLNRNN